MKKSLIFWIILGVLLSVLVITLIFNLIYFNNLHKSMRAITEPEKQKVIEIVNQSFNLEDYEIRFGNIYIVKDKEIAQIELIKTNSKIYYSVDLDKGKLIRR